MGGFQDLNITIGANITALQKALGNAQGLINQTSNQMRKFKSVAKSMGSGASKAFGGLGNVLQAAGGQLGDIGANIQTLLTGDPFSKIAAGAELAWKGIKALMSAMDDSTEAFAGYKEAIDKAIDSSSKEISQTQLLISVVNDNKISLQQRNNAYEKLHSRFPKYFKANNRAKMSEEELKKASDNATASLLKRAATMSAMDKLSKLFSKKLKIETSADGGASIWEKELNMANTLIFGGRYKTRADFVKENTEGIKAEIVKITDWIKINGNIGAAIDESLKIKEPEKPFKKKIKRVKDKIKEVKDEIIDLAPVTTKAITPLKTTLVEAIQLHAIPALDALKFKTQAVYAKLGSFTKKYVGVAQQANAAISQLLKDTANLVGDSIADIITGDINEDETIFGKIMEIVANFMAMLGKSLIAAGIAGEAFQKLVTNPALAIGAGIALVAAAGVVRNQMAAGPGGNSSNSSTYNSGGGYSNVPKFASGGLVYGPTLGLMGEYSGAANNPEVVAPLSKLKGMMENSGGGHIPSVKIKGSDLLIVFDRARKIQSRTV